MRIREVAVRAGITSSAIRYYESAGVLRPSRRTQSGYRDYGEDVIPQLTFIGRAKECGFTLPEIRKLISGDSRDLDMLVSRKLVALSARRRSLQLVETRLRALRSRPRSKGVIKLRQLFDEEATVAKSSMEATRRSERAILNEARDEATDLRHGWIGAEHVLLALLNRHHRASALVGVRLSARTARREIVTTLGRGEQDAQELSVTPRVQRMIGIVQGLAGERTRKDLPTWWLLALIDAGESVATSVLERGGVDLKKLRAELVALIAES